MRGGSTNPFCVRYIWSRYLTTETQYQTLCDSLSVSQVEEYFLSGYGASVRIMVMYACHSRDELRHKGTCAPTDSHPIAALELHHFKTLLCINVIILQLIDMFNWA